MLKPGGLLRCQINGLPASAAGYDTWQGVRVSAAEIREFALTNDFQLLALEGAGTQYMWVTLAKRPAGWHAGLSRPSHAHPRRCPAPHQRLRHRTAGHQPRPVRRHLALDRSSPARVRPPAPGSLRRRSRRPAPSTSVPSRTTASARSTSPCPPELRTVFSPSCSRWLGEPLCPPVTLRVVPPGPSIPRVVALSDAVDLLSGATIRSGIVKLVLEEVERIAELPRLLRRPGNLPARDLLRRSRAACATKSTYIFPRACRPAPIVSNWAWAGANWEILPSSSYSPAALPPI